MVATGLERLLSDRARWLRGRTFGLVTNSEARGPEGTQGWRLLQDLCGPDLVALFSPEHGLSARADDATGVADARAGGLPVYSLYGPDELRSPRPWMLEGVRVLLFDLQDVGARYYTYLSTLLECLRAAAAQGVPVMVLDRPNPLGGLAVEGPGVSAGYENFVAGLDVPVRHGLTLGELALLAQRRLGLPAEAVEVVPADGLSRSTSWEETGLVWHPPSPAATGLGMVRVYPGTCLVEGTTASEGRGTDAPFEVVGAPWLDAYALARELAALAPAGSRQCWPAVAPAWFRPGEWKHAGTPCEGVRVSSPEGWRRGPLSGQGPGPVAFGVALLQAMLQQGREEFAWRRGPGGEHWLDLLAGGPGLREGLSAGVPWQEIAEAWRAREERHREETADLRLYPVGAEAPSPRLPAVQGSGGGAGAGERAHELDLMTPLELATVLVAAAGEAVEAVRPALRDLARAIEEAAGRVGRGGRLVYAGAGTSGRLGVLDATECAPTFGVREGRVLGLIAGGREALWRPVEGAEDGAEAGELAVEEAGIGPADVLVGVSASGETAFTVACVARARERGALTVAVTAQGASPIARAAEIVVSTPVGTEPLQGSTRLKAGTAHKVVLNAISTGVFASLGYVYGDKMVGVQPVNAKLRLRASRLVGELTGAPAGRVLEAIDAALGVDPRRAVRIAVLMLLRRVGASEARDMLVAGGCSLRRALSPGDPRARQ